MHQVPTRRAVLGGSLAYAGGLLHPAEARASPLIPAPILREDADILQSALQSLHPGLLRYQSPAAIEARFAALRDVFGQSRTLAQAHLAVAGLTAQIRCGHTFLNPLNQTAESLALISAGRTRLPIRFRWIGGALIVLGSDKAGATLAPGSEVRAIGGTPVRDILSRLLPYAPADGANDARRVRLMEIRGEDEWALFDIYLALAFPALVRNDTVSLSVRAPDGRDRTEEVQLLTQAERAAAARSDTPAHGSGAPAWRVETLPGGAVRITMPTWALFNSQWNWRDSLNQTFDRLVSEKTPALILDIRGNAGGLAVGDAILARLSDRDLPRAAQHQLVRYRRTPPRLDPFLTTWNKSFRDWGQQARGPDDQGFYHLVRAEQDGGGGFIRPLKSRFAGKTIVLTDPANSSATFTFAACVKANGLATLVGQTTGGSRRGINGGAFFFLRLPGTGLEIDVPLIGYFPETPQPDEGIRPDVAVAVTAADVAAGRDPELQAALALVRA